MPTTNNIRIKNLRPLIAPNLLLDEIPINDKAKKTVIYHRQLINDILLNKDQRFLVVVGPCSIHDPDSALDYAQHLKPLAEKYQEQLCIVMRVYFEKPRTTVGWKGLINDPKLDDSFDINHGLRIARSLLLKINELGLATGSEFLDTIIPQYISDLTSWTAIGARTTESQIHRELASGLSMPVGFKNSTTGNIQVAIDAIKAANNAHHFLGISPEGVAAIVATAGNPNCHIILRGSNSGPNYDPETINKSCEQLQFNQLPTRVMVDCSHGNSSKNYVRQIEVVQEIAARLRQNHSQIFGLMIESNLIEGNQPLIKNKPLTYGQSITDACINWLQTEELLAMLNEAAFFARERNQCFQSL